MDKLDFKKEDRAFYTGKPGRWDRLTLPEMTFLAIEGQGDPDGPAYARGARARSTRSPMASSSPANPTAPTSWCRRWKPCGGPTIRGLSSPGDRAAWRWRAMIRMPDSVTPEALDAARAAARRKGKDGPLDLGDTSPALPKATACRHCTSAPTATKRPCSRVCTTRSCPRKGSTSPDRTTRSTCPTRERPGRKS